MKETGHRFRETVLALGGGKAPLEVGVKHVNVFLLCLLIHFLSDLHTANILPRLFNDFWMHIQVFVQFRGREPSPEPLLRHNGLLSATASA